jgi:hypothetical protein
VTNRNSVINESASQAVSESDTKEYSSSFPECRVMRDGVYIAVHALGVAVQGYRRTTCRLVSVCKGRAGIVLKRWEVSEQRRCEESIGDVRLRRGN